MVSGRWVNRVWLGLCVLSLGAYVVYSEALRVFCGEVTRLAHKIW
jgi:hypothetical protein